MHAGHYISGAGHLGLIGWVLIGGWLTPAHEPFEFTEVSVISSAEFEALSAVPVAPQNVTEIAQPAAPAEVTEPPEVDSVPDEVTPQPAPLQAEAPPEEVPPEAPEQTLPPQTQAQDSPPELSEPVGDLAVLVPEVAPEAAPRPVERVAPEPVAPPEPEAVPDPDTQEAAQPDDAGEAPEQEAQEATAPEEATTEIVTEATAAPAASVRPPGRRPAAPAPAPAPQQTAVETPAPEAPAENPVSNDDVLAALRAAQEPAPAPAGPPLSAGEKDALRVAVSRCWNIGSLSTEALGTIVVLGVAMNQDGTPQIDTIRMISASGGSDAAARRVFDSARRALILCGANGYDLPAEKFAQWQNIEITFDPSKMGF